MNLVGTIIFLVVVISSIAQMIKEGKQGPSKRPRGQKPLTRDMLPEATRRKLYGDPGAGPRVATPKQAEPRQATPAAAPPQRSQAPPRREEPLAPGRQLLDALSGRAQSMEEEEGWTPVQPAPRREMPRPVQPPPLPEAQRAEQPRPVQSAPPRVSARQEQRPSRRERPSRRTAQVRQQRAQHPQRAPRRKMQSAARPAEAVSRRRRGPSSVLFGGLGDVRKAIVFAEILGPPKSMER